MSKNTNKPLSENPTWQAIGAYAEAKAEIARLTAENERLRKLLEMYLKADPLIGEAVASAMLAAKEGGRK